MTETEARDTVVGTIKALVDAVTEAQGVIKAASQTVAELQVANAGYQQQVETLEDYAESQGWDAHTQETALAYVIRVCRKQTAPAQLTLLSTTPKARRAFEVQAQKAGLSLQRSPRGHYLVHSTQVEWLAYCAKNGTAP